MLDRNWKLHQGAQFTPENPAFRGQLSQADIERLRADKFWCNRINQKYIDKTLKLAQWQQIRVFWVLPPVLPALQSVRDRSGADARHTEFVSTFLKKYPNLTAIDARTAGFLSTHFIDPIHLTGQGALALSRQVGKIVSAPSAVHWVKLSPELDTSGAEAYENLHQSEVAIRAELSRVRR